MVKGLNSVPTYVSCMNCVGVTSTNISVPCQVVHTIRTIMELNRHMLVCLTTLRILGGIAFSNQSGHPGLEIGA